MNAWWHCVVRNPAIRWLAAVALLAQLLIPVHFHLHHGADHDTHAHPHVALDRERGLHAHVLTDSEVVEHFDDDDSRDLNPVPEVFAKQKSTLGLVAVLTIASPLLMPAADRSTNTWSFKAGDRVTQRSYYALKPPLRAPPPVS